MIMGLDIYISRKTSSGKECLIHWHKFGPLAEWFKEKIYDGKLDCNERPWITLRWCFCTKTALPHWIQGIGKRKCRNSSSL